MLKRSYQIQVKKGHRLYDYFEKMSINSKNMYNVTNFYIRQVYTALKNDSPLKELQQQVLKEIEVNLPFMNEAQRSAYEKRIAKEMSKPEEKRKKVTLNLFDFPTKEKAFLSYNFLDCFFKIIKQCDYRSLPTQSAQSTMKKVYDDWMSYFEAKKEYEKNPEKFTGKPRIPKYKKGLKEVYFTNQDCVVKDEKFLKFPFIKEQLNIGKMGLSGKLKQVRIVPRYNLFIVELVMDVVEKELVVLAENRVMALDFGVNNFVTGVFSTGDKPFILNGRPLKSINQFYNRERACLYGILRQGKQPNEGNFTSKQLEKLDLTRFNKTKDYYHKASKWLIDEAVGKQVSTIIVGKNDGWKQEIMMRKKDKQNFIFISHALFIDILTYKAEAVGIKVIVQEESYTSKASAIDLDDIPTYGDKHIPTFSGRRIKRGLYKSKHGILINADVNGAYNILRKAVPRLFEGIEVVVSQPRKLSVA